MALALFDLDNTLLAGDSDHGWGQFLVDQGIVDPVLFKQTNDRFFEQYQSGELDIYEYSEFSLGTLSRFEDQQLQQWRQQFMREVVAPMQLAKGRQQIAEHKQQGDTVVIITATNAFVTTPIAQDFGADHLIATEPEIQDGRFTGKVAGTPCFQAGKITRLQQWLQQTALSMADSVFYSDSFNDLPLLEVVDKPIAVDPDPVLQQHAERLNWPIISFR